MYLRINAFALSGRTNDNTIHTQGVASLALGYALVWAFSPCIIGCTSVNGKEFKVTVWRKENLKSTQENENSTQISTQESKRSTQESKKSTQENENSIYWKVK